jgi:hypothetical protein
MADLRYHHNPDRPAFLGVIHRARQHHGRSQWTSERCTRCVLYPGKKSNAQWFNPAAFTAPPLVAINGVQYANYGNSGYNVLRGPYYQSWDMNLEKTFGFVIATACNFARRRSTPSTIQTSARQTRRSLTQQLLAQSRALAAPPPRVPVRSSLSQSSTSKTGAVAGAVTYTSEPTWE